MSMRTVEPRAEAEYLAAFTAIMKRMEGAAGAQTEPVVLCVGGGAALHLYTGSRAAKDIDATILSEFLPPANLNAAYRGVDGHARLLYFDTQFAGGFSLLHRHAYRDSLPIILAGVDARRLDVRLLAPVDLAVSRLARFDRQDARDIAALARAGLVGAEALRRRAEEALAGFEGNAAPVRDSIEAALELVRKATLH